MNRQLLLIIIAVMYFITVGFYETKIISNKIFIFISVIMFIVLLTYNYVLDMEGKDGSEKRKS